MTQKIFQLPNQDLVKLSSFFVDHNFMYSIFKTIHLENLKIYIDNISYLKMSIFSKRLSENI